MITPDCAFERLTEENVLSLQPYFQSHAYGICDNTIGAVYQWRDIYATYFAVSGGFLCIRYGGGQDCYTVPIGEGNLDAAFDRIECDAGKRNLPVRFCVVPEEAMPVLRYRYGDRLRVQSIRDWADYLYDADAFRTYAGKHLHTQKNHVNRFYREHPDAETRLILDPETEASVYTFLDRFKEEHPELSELEKNELNGARELLKNRERLGQTAACLLAEGRVVGLSIGEVKHGTLYVHVEKALKEVSGSYPAMAQAFVRLFPEVYTVNREDDGGDDGLRYSKLQYKPRELIEKYLVTLSN